VLRQAKATADEGCLMFKTWNSAVAAAEDDASVSAALDAEERLP